jgi:hypothetical protein
MLPASSLRPFGRRLAEAVRAASRYRGMLIIVLWQAPVGPVPGPDGSIGFLFGGGLDQFVTEFGCDGPTQTASQKYRLAAAEADYDLSRVVRVEAVGGGVRWEPQDVVGWPMPEKSSGVFGQLNVRGDWQRWGLGAGVLVLPDMNHDTNAGYDTRTQGYTAKPSAYLRYGPGESFHGRLDVTPPNVLGAQVPARIGVGWNAINRDRVAWFVGFAALGSSPELLGSGIAGEATLPLSTRASVRALAHYGTGYDKTLSGVAVGGRFAFGPRAPAAVGEGDR